MSAAAKPAVNDCPEGGKHTFVLGRCFNCGLSIREHKARVKEANRERMRKKPRVAAAN